MRSGAGTTISDDSTAGCVVGAVALAGGVYANGVLGGIAAVAGIVAMATWC
jgi:hypothetical protein